jgi:sulfite reductase alpha subunit-like flavoprotein
MCKGVQKLLMSIATEKLGDENKAEEFLKSLANSGRYAWEQWG